MKSRAIRSKTNLLSLRGVRLYPYYYYYLMKYSRRGFFNTYLQYEYSYIKIPIYSVYLKSIKSIISGNVINCCLASSALTQF